MIAFADPGSDEAAFNRTAIYKDELLGSALAAHSRLSDKATKSDAGRSSVGYLNQALQKLNTDNSGSLARLAVK